MTRGRVAVLKVEPSTVLESIDQLCRLAGMREALDPGATTILKDNISWHFPFPAANTTPWQLEGTIRALRGAGFEALSCVQNKTVVTDAFKGEDLNYYLPILSRYDVPVLYNFKDEDMTWVEHRPKSRMRVLDTIYPDGIFLPEYFFGKNIVHLPTTKCVAGGTEVMLADGTMTPIEELVARQIHQAREVNLDEDGDVRVDGACELMGMDDSGRVKPMTATSFWRTSAHGRRLLRVRTRTGRAITATADHRVHTPAGWSALGDLRIGSRIAIARKIEIRGTSQPLPRTHAAGDSLPVVARAGRLFSAAFNQTVINDYPSGTTVTALAVATGLRWQSIQSILKRHHIRLRRNIKQLALPERTSAAFWRWLGYVIAEGCIERGKASKLWWINSTPQIRDEFRTLTQDLFGLEATSHKSNHGCHIYSRNLSLFLEEIGLQVPLNAGNKTVPRSLYRCPDYEIAAFLSGYLDGDGHISSKRAEVSAVTKSLRLAQDLQVLFTRLGVVAFVKPIKCTIPGVWTEPRLYYRISVAGESLIRLDELFSLRHPEKKRRLAMHAERLRSSKRPSNWDTVPLPREEYRSLRIALGVTQASSGLPSTVNSLENGHQLPTPRMARRLIAALDERPGGAVDEVRLARLRAMVHEDLAWDHVEFIEELTDTHLQLFDVTVPEGSSFVGNGIVLHNCHIYTTTTGAMKNAFGGLLHDHRHYTHSWIHETLVDLLAIQKEIHAGLFAVMDGTTAGNGPGPRTMEPIVKNVLLASADQVAIDAVAARMMGFDPLAIPYIRLAHEDGLGVGDPREIEVVGHDVSPESWGFHVGDNGASLVGDLLWFSPLKRFQKLFFRTPLVNVFILGSEVYHDYYRWPLRDRRVFERWRRETSWGQLFDRYARGPIAPPPSSPEAADVPAGESGS